VVTAACVVAGAYLVYQWFRQAGAAADSSFKNLVLADAAGWIAGQVGASEAEVAEALRGLIDKGASHALLARLRGIECEVTKLTPTVARRTVVVMLDAGDGTARVGKIAREIGFDDLPDSVRGDFITLSGDTHTFQIVGPATARKKEVSA
jgi:hypothetical protein